ncbi:hypothetical protein [Spiroplasma alleghenense]|uniref:Uncharacterized protein n=1 Tax=Spiroplasma alleghenense TaxID=216931 RepID=A0A345Z2R4_9MOLU|nr:hypothetical protein [Spiroplasma alleghenense]AXK50893.1 hypothetical protein SALLE_v1c02170 [Spiroplasma alleghenense]
MNEKTVYKNFNFKTQSYQSDLKDFDSATKLKPQELKSILLEIFEVQKELLVQNQTINQRNNWLITFLASLISFIVGFCLNIFLNISFTNWVAWFLMAALICFGAIIAGLLTFGSKGYKEFDKITKNLDIFILKLRGNFQEKLNPYLFEDLKTYKTMMNGILLNNKELSNIVDGLNKYKNQMEFKENGKISTKQNHLFLQKNAYIVYRDCKIQVNDWKITLMLVERYNELFN